MQKVTVTNVIDGDTIDISTGERIRLAGINTPEKGELCYNEAKLFTEMRLLGKEVRLVNLGMDKYGRGLAEVYVDNENFNLAVLKKGYANVYYSEGIAWQDYVNAENVGRSEVGCMWRESEVGKCVDVERVGRVFLLQNRCNVTIVTTALLRDTSTSHRFTKQLNLRPYATTTISEDCGTDDAAFLYLCQHVFNEDGDELLIYDSDGLLGWTAYGKYTTKS